MKVLQIIDIYNYKEKGRLDKHHNEKEKRLARIKIQKAINNW